MKNGALNWLSTGFCFVEIGVLVDKIIAFKFHEFGRFLEMTRLSKYFQKYFRHQRFVQSNWTQKTLNRSMNELSNSF